MHILSRLFRLFTLSLCMLSGCSLNGIERTTLYQGEVYKWRIDYVVAKNWPASTQKYYEVYWKDRLVVLPKEIFNDVRDIQGFIAAGGFQPGETNYDSVIVVFENIVKRPDGFDTRHFRTMMLTPEHPDKLIITDLFTNQGVEITEPKSQ